MAIQFCKMCRHYIDIWRKQNSAKIFRYPWGCTLGWVLICVNLQYVYHSNAQILYLSWCMYRPTRRELATNFSGHTVTQDTSSYVGNNCSAAAAAADTKKRQMSSWATRESLQHQQLSDHIRRWKSVSEGKWQRKQWVSREKEREREREREREGGVTGRFVKMHDSCHHVSMYVLSKPINCVKQPKYEQMPNNALLFHLLYSCFYAQ